MGLADTFQGQLRLRDAGQRPSQASQNFVLELLKEEQLDGKVDVAFCLRLAQRLDRAHAWDHAPSGDGASSQLGWGNMHINRSLTPTQQANVTIYETDAPLPSFVSGGEFQFFHHAGDSQRIFPRLVFTGSDSPPREQVKWVPRGLQFFRPPRAHPLTEDDMEFLAFVETYPSPANWPQIWEDWKKRYPQARSQEPKNLKKRYDRLQKRLTQPGVLCMLHARPVLLTRQPDGTYTATVSLAEQTAVGATVTETLAAVERKLGDGNEEAVQH
jgi:hypothetical protein